MKNTIAARDNKADCRFVEMREKCKSQMRWIFGERMMRSARANAVLVVRKLGRHVTRVRSNVVSDRK